MEIGDYIIGQETGNVFEVVESRKINKVKEYRLALRWLERKVTYPEPNWVTDEIICPVFGFDIL